MSRSSLVLCLLSCLLFCVSSLAVAREAAVIRGRALDAQSLNPVELVRLSLDGTDRVTWTRTDGLFEFENVPLGTYTVRAFHGQYEEIVQEGVGVATSGEVTLEFLLAATSVPLEKIVVTPGSFSFMETGGATRQTMSREDIQLVPQLGDDVFRAVNRLPGLSSGDYSAHFSIRGGRHDETLILLDQLELYEPYHLKDFAEGAISIIDTETIQGVELMTGGFPARYGNKRSGVFSIASRVPELDRTRYSIGASFLNARAMAMGPMGSKGSWFASARSGYMDVVFNIINQDELPSPRYHDVFAKLSWELNPAHTLTFAGLHAGDRYKFDAASTTGFNDTLSTREEANNSYGNSYIWGTLQSNIGTHTTMRTILHADLVTRDRDGTEYTVEPRLPIYEIMNKRDFSIFGVRQDWGHDLTNNYVLSYGFDYRRQHSKDEATSLVDQDPNDPSDPGGNYPITLRSSLDVGGNLLAAYMSNRWRVVDPLILEFGARYDHASWTGDDDFSARTSAALRIGKGRTLRAAWGQYRQIHGIDDVSALDVNQAFYPSELTLQWTLGVEQLFDNGAIVRLDAYYKEGSNLRPRYRNWKGGIDTFPESNEDRILVYPESNQITGFETYWDQRFGERVKARASYSFAFAEEVVTRMDNVNAPDPLTFDRTHDIPTDQRHAVNADLTYHFGRVWSMNASFAFHTGWPATTESLVDTVTEDGEPEKTVRPNKIYGERLPHYHRLDMRMTRRWSTSRGDWRLFFELVNVTNHANVFGYDYRKEISGNGSFVLVRDDERWFTILPSLGVSWTSSF